MDRHLMIDIGAGTMDILVWTNEELHTKAVALSPVRTVAAEIEQLPPGPVAVLGGEMGGGPVTAALVQRAATDEVVATAEAAATVHHDRARVEARGIRIADDDTLARLARDHGHHAVHLGDIEPQRLEAIVTALGLPFQFETVAVCVQDHGVAPPGVSHLEFRHTLMHDLLNDDPDPARALFAADEVPAQFNRLRTVARDAGRLPTNRVFVMDSGMAAIVGGCTDPLCQGLRTVAILDVATSHTVGAIVDQGKLAAHVEVHTAGLTVETLDRLIVDLAEGRLHHDKVVQAGGHGATCRQTVGYDALGVILATGPKRARMANSSLPLRPGAPLGDNMMTGTAGLLRAVQQRLGLPSPWVGS